MAKPKTLDRKPKLLQRLHDLFESSGHTAYSLSEETGIPYSTTRRLLLKDRSPQILTVEDLIEYLETHDPIEPGSWRCERNRA